MVKVVLSVWIVAVLAGFGFLAKYSASPGTQFNAPSKVAVESVNLRPSLFVFLHPQCPCSTATVAELERIQAQTGSKLDINIDIVTPTKGESWTQTGLAKRVESNRNWHVQVDPDGKFAASMGAATSGFSVLYDGGGNKVFQGGITSARGHEGDNAGHDAVVQFAHEGTVSVHSTPVYGCLFGDLGASK